MMIRFLAGVASAQKTDVLALFVFQGTGTSLASLQGDKRLAFLPPILKEEKWTGKKDEWVAFRTLGKLKATRVGVLGLGEEKACTEDGLRVAAGKVMRKALEVKARSIVVTLPVVKDMAPETMAQALAEGFRLAAYRFHGYKKQDPKHPLTDVKEVIVCVLDRSVAEAFRTGFARADVLAQAVHLCRDLVNTPSADMTPQTMVEAAQALATEGSRITMNVMPAKTMEEMGMRAALAIGRGSQHAPVGVHMTYTPEGTSKKRIVIVGKAVTFDSGGLSLKPADSMMTMKCDMAGGATVIGLFKALSALKLPFEIHGIFLAVENMPSGTACRPGDVVVAKNGTSIEILNTDAEGRVTLADALAYASEQKPDVLIDLATLTGACVVALGEQIAAVLGNDRALTDALVTAGRETGDTLWELPLVKEYGDHIKSKIADVKNIGNRGEAGTITAALFLEKFVGKNIPWAHLDIAGPAYAEKESRPDQPVGGTGFGVRLLVRYLQALSTR
ncbi:MAG: leucyl aminopeptidase [Patescibacteria group bacterium]